jgi:beta-phosphoglucomutase-like phosphatase (HAD superfamily)
VTPRKALEDVVVKHDPSVAEQEEVEEKYKDTLAKIRKMTKATHDLAYDASWCAAKSKAVLKEKPYLQDMLGAYKGQMNVFNEAKDQIISDMTSLADEEPKPDGFLLAQQLLEQGNHHLEAFKCGVFSDVKANVK